MKRIIDELFVTEENRGYSLDDIIAIRIQNGEFYFLGWMENAECYSIQWAKSNSKIERDLLIASDDIYDASDHITISEGGTHPKTDRCNYIG